MTQKQLSEKVGKDHRHVSRWERDAAVPDIETVERLAAVLGVSAVELLTGRSADQQKRTIRLTVDNFADHLSIDYAASLVKGVAVPEDGIDHHDSIVSKLLAWLQRESVRTPGVQYEMSRHVAALVLERLAGRT
jgi:transcriptional regulator with XRE-family HTH domain